MNENLDRFRFADRAPQVASLAALCIGFLYVIGWLARTSLNAKWGLGPLDISHESALGAGVAIVLVLFPLVVPYVSALLARRQRNLAWVQLLAFLVGAIVGEILMQQIFLVLTGVVVPDKVLWRMYAIEIGGSLMYVVFYWACGAIVHKSARWLKASIAATIVVPLLTTITIVMIYGGSLLETFKPQFGGPTWAKVSVQLTGSPVMNAVLIDTDHNDALLKLPNGTYLRVPRTRILSISSVAAAK